VTNVDDKIVIVVVTIVGAVHHCRTDSSARRPSSR
jgi:hypothetical protein